MTLGNERRTCR